MTFDEAIEILTAFHRAGVDYVVVDSMAMAAHGLPRATQDLDVFIGPKRENIEKVKEVLGALFDDPEVDQIDAEELMGTYPAVQYIPPHQRWSLDLLTRLGEAFRYEDLGVETIDVGGTPIRVATPATLFRMKSDTVRPQDRADALRIQEAFDVEDDRS